MGTIKCLCGNEFSDTGSPNESMHVVRDRDMDAYCRYVWRSYQLCDIDRKGMIPDQGTDDSKAFHASLCASIDLEGELWECAACGRLLFQRPGEQGFRYFRPESFSKAELSTEPNTTA